MKSEVRLLDGFSNKRADLIRYTAWQQEKGFCFELRHPNGLLTYEDQCRYARL